MHYMSYRHRVKQYIAVNGKGSLSSPLTGNLSSGLRYFLEPLYVTLNRSSLMISS